MKNLVNSVRSETMELREEAITSNSGNIKQAFKINIRAGKGFYETGSTNSFWSRLRISAKIFQPQSGAWKIVIRDRANKNLVVYENYNVLHDKEILFTYKTGLKVNFLIEAIWTQTEDTILSGEICIM